METPQLLLPAARAAPSGAGGSTYQRQGHAANHPAPNPLEEPEYICRYTVTKHSWRGKYKRVLCISPTQILTLDPTALTTTNEYDIATDFEGAAPVAGGREDPLQQHALEFIINVRNEGRGKFKPMRFSSRYRAAILTELHKLRSHRIPGAPSSTAESADFPVLHLRRRASDWSSFVMRITGTGIELRTSNGNLHWCLDFRDMDSPAIILLSDAFGRRGHEGGGFVLCPLFGRKCKAFTAAVGVSNSSILTTLTRMAKSSIGISLNVDSTQSMGAPEFLKQRAKTAVGAEETPIGEWSVTRIRTTAHGTAHSGILQILYGIKGLGGPNETVSRQLVLTKRSLVERRTNNYEAVIVRPLSAVAGLVRFAEEPQMFAIDFNDGCPMHVYSSTSRDNLLAAVRDTIQSEGQRPIPMLARVIMPGHRLDPPCGRVLAPPSPVTLSGPHRLFADVEGEALHIKHLTAAAKDAVAENGSIPGSKARLWRRVQEFNACVPYEGLQPHMEVTDVTLMTLLSMLPGPLNLPPDSPPPPPPSPKAAGTLVGLVACLRRLMGSSYAASFVASLPVAASRLMGLLQSGSGAVAMEAAGLVAMLIGGGPGENTVLAMTRGEKHADVILAKSAMLGSQLHIMILVYRLKPSTVSPLLSMAIVEVLEAMLCEPHSETTDHSTFVEMLRQVAGLKRRLFALFGHPAEGVRETIAVIMRAIAEEDAVAAESMRDAALRDGALLRHLVHAFFLPASERREVSRQLVALWADAHQPALDLLSRVVPPGLVAYLQTRPTDEEEFDAQSLASSTSSAQKKQQRILQRRKGKVPRKSNTSISSSSLNPFSAPPLDVGNVQQPQQNANQNSPTTQVSTASSQEENVHSSSKSSLSSPMASGPSQALPALAQATTVNPYTSGDQFLGSTIHVNNVPSGIDFQPPAPAPAQIITENVTTGSGGLLSNWPEFWRVFVLDHSRADLIWNERTRQELREALQAEVHLLDVEKERTVDVSVLGRVVVAGDNSLVEESISQLSWNFAEFAVRYPSLSKEVCVGQYYLRLLLESGSGAEGFPLRDPVVFFRALYHRFLCDADIGLTVEGSTTEDLGVDWCDMAGLDGFGGGGGTSVRDLCARAMTIVYEQHHQTIGPFDGTPHITVLVDRTSDRTLRHRCLLLLKALLLEPANAKLSIAVGGCVLAVDLLTTAHEASERTAIPLQSNLIAANAFVEPQKEWHFVTKAGGQVGPVEKDAIRRAWSKQDIDWNSKCWAQGMTEWKRLRDIRELRWALGNGVAVLTPVQVGEVALSILHSMVGVHSDLDDAGELVTPTPRVKRILTSPWCLNHIAQAMLTGEPALVENAASLLQAILTRNPKSMARLYNTGAFYFALAYGGSNLDSVAQLFASTHVYQGFHGGADAAVSSSLPLAKRSVLGGLLPESLLYVLERSGPSAFAAGLVSDSDTPEIIWTHKMRGERLIDQVFKHLGDFPQKLPQHCHALYEFAPMPPVTYPELQDEMWCHRYYLRNLCDQIRFPEWPIVEHIEFLQSLLSMWKEELTRRPLDLSEEEACAILEISSDETETSGENGESEEDGKASAGKIFGRVDEEILKRQYRRLAMRYHPDKNPQGREKFVAVQKAYERLQATLQGLQGPQPWRLQLLLKAQCILFSRYGAVLEPFKYAGYPMLLNVITIDREDNTFLSPERAPLLEAATELIWLTCCSSALNGEELVRDGGILLLATLLARCMSVVQKTTPSTDPAAVIVGNIMRTFAGLSTFESARQEMLQSTGFTVDVVHCCELELATTAVEAALQTVAHLAASTKLQDALLKAGVIWYLMPLLLQYDSTAENSSASGPQIGNSIQASKNMHAMLAVRALARLAGLLDDDLYTPSNDVAAKALREMLTPKLAAMLSNESPRELLRNLNSNVESPQIIWNSAMRAELLNFVEDQRMSQLADGTYDMQAAQDFKYKVLMNELHVGDVYLRVFNEQPESEIMNEQYLCVALVNFISNIMEERQGLSEVEVVPESDPISQTRLETGPGGNLLPPVPTEDQSDVKAPTEEGEEKGDDVSSEVTSDVSSSSYESPGKILIKKLTMALKALQNVLNANSELTSVFSSKERLSPLLSCLLDTGPSSDQVPQICLNVLARLTVQASCVEALAADRSALLLLLQLLHCAPACRSGALRVLYSLASTSELAWAAAKHGGVVYILQLVLPGQEEVSIQTRISAASLLGKLIGQPMHGPRVGITVARFLPDGLVSAIRDGPGDAVVTALEQSSETPELVWSPAMAASLGAQLATMAADLYREQTKGKVVEWDLPETSSRQQDVNEEPQVGGVYVRLFLKDPKFPLRNPKRFLEGLLDKYVTAAAATHARGGSQVDPQLPLLLSAALVSLLRVQPLLADHIAHLGYVPKLVSAMANEGRIVSTVSSQQVLVKSGSREGEVIWEAEDGEGLGSQTPQEMVRLSCLRVLHQLAASTACAEAMATPGMGSPQIVPLLMKAIGWPGGSVLALETLKRVVAAGNRARDALVAQGLKVGLVEVLLGILDWRAGGRNGLCSQMKWNENEASVGRVLAVEALVAMVLECLDLPALGESSSSQVLQAFAGEGAHSAKVQNVLSSSDVWSAYKDQRHDLFLPSNAQTAAAGIAGLIEGSSGAVKYALPSPTSRSAVVRLSGTHNSDTGAGRQ